MPVAVGTLPAVDVRVGAGRAAAVYVGATKVWPPDTPPPAGAAYSWAGTSGSAVVDVGQCQRFGTGGAAVFHIDGPATGTEPDFAAAVGLTLTLTGQTSGAVHTSTVTASNLVSGHRRLVLATGIPSGTHFALGELVGVVLA